MNIITETRENIENWFGRKQRKAYRRMQGITTGDTCIS